jgi:hypothetical protein
MMLIPVATAFGAPLGNMLALVLGGLGLGAVGAVGISHLSSAMGNRMQRKLWPRWPFDSPTNRWLHPQDTTRSTQQKQSLYKAIKRLTKLDIPAAAETGDHELERVINDAVSQLRYRLRESSHADRLDHHNADYGFARNFAGLRVFWLTFAVLSAAGCLVGYLRLGHPPLWCAVSAALAVAGFFLAFVVLCPYVRDRGWHYAESFFSAILELDRAESQQAKADKAASTS